MVLMWSTSSTHIPFATMLILISCLAVAPRRLEAEAPQFDGTPRPIAQLRPGMTLQLPGPHRNRERDPDSDRAAGGNPRSVAIRPLLIARPRLAAGDVQGLSSTIFEFAGLTHPAIVASVVKLRDPGQPATYQLHQVGIGLTVPRDGRHVVVTSETASQLGFEFDFVRRQVIAHTERQLEQVVQVARNSENVLFDIPAVLFRDQQHQAMTIRHLVQLDPDQGEVSTILWLLRTDQSGRYRLVEDSMEILPAGFQEDRRIHVQRDKFILGIPTPEAFAMVDIPRGRRLPIPANVERWASASAFMEREFSSLTEAIQRGVTEGGRQRAPTENSLSPRGSQ
jgi:hypothetical protein